MQTAASRAVLCWRPQVSTMWLGWVLAISLTEAWVKFKAPMLDRHVAVGCCFLCWGVYWGVGWGQLFRYLDSFCRGNGGVAKLEGRLFACTPAEAPEWLLFLTGKARAIDCCTAALRCGDHPRALRAF